MKKIRTYLPILLCCFLLTGCASSCNIVKHTKSSWIGLHRRITLYNANGQPIRTWETRAKVEDNGGTCWFLDDKGKAITISGTFLIEEL